MSVHRVFLTAHIAAGSAGLVLGPVAAFTAKRRGIHTTVGTYYYWAFVVLFVSSLLLAAMDWDQDSFLVPIGVFSYGWALLGYQAAKRRWRNWLGWHVAGQGGSYIAMTTALLVVNLGTDATFAWFLPSIIGTPLIVWVNFQIAMGRRPKSRPDLAARASSPRSSPAA
jgi:hypothetical protein